MGFHESVKSMNKITMQIGLNFVGQNFSSDKISSPLEILVTLVRQNFLSNLKSRQWALNRSFTVTFIKNNLDKIFVGLNFSSD